MTYADTLLANGERIIRREHQHWFVLAWTARYALLAVILGIVLMIVATAGNVQGAPRDLAGIITLFAVIVGLIVLGWTYLRFRNEEYVITSRRIIHAEGVINKKSSDSSLEKINDAVLSQSLFGRIFGFGDLDVLTASETGIERLRMLVDALGFKKAMLEAKHELEIELTRPVMPPLRSSGAGGVGGASTTGATDATQPTGPAQAPAALTADEVTKALAQLADLRDRGVVTPAEFEAKKAQLLARL